MLSHSHYDRSFLHTCYPSGGDRLLFGGGPVKVEIYRSIAKVLLKSRPEKIRKIRNFNEYDSALKAVFTLNSHHNKTEIKNDSKE